MKLFLIFILSFSFFAVGQQDKDPDQAQYKIPLINNNSFIAGLSENQYLTINPSKVFVDDSNVFFTLESYQDVAHSDLTAVFEIIGRFKYSCIEDKYETISGYGTIKPYDDSVSNQNLDEESAKMLVEYKLNILTTSIDNAFGSSCNTKDALPVVYALMELHEAAGLLASIEESEIIKGGASEKYNAIKFICRTQFPSAQGNPCEKLNANQKE